MEVYRLLLLEYNSNHPNLKAYITLCVGDNVKPIKNRLKRIILLRSGFVRLVIYFTLCLKVMSGIA